MTTQARKVTIELGFIPPRELAPNYEPHSRIGHIIKTKKKKLMRNSGYEHGKAELGTWLGVGRIKLTYTFYHYRKIDLDAYPSMMKNWVDGVVETGVVKDDDPEHVSYGEHQWVKTPKGESRVEIVVEEIA